MASYELYLILVLCMGAVILSALACIWMILSTSKFGKEHRLLSILSKVKKLARGAPLTEPEPKEAETSSALEVEQKLVESTLPQKLEINLEGTRGTILQAYFKTMKAVGKMTEISMKPQMTLREFLKEVTPELSSATKVFAELTSLAEKALYSCYMPREDGASRAKNLASKVEKVISKS